jgi:pentatricopeptide repeat protein
VQAYTRAGQLEDAFKVLERLKEVSIRPNVVIYTSLVHGCLLAGDVDRAWDTFDHMRQREAIEPDEVAFTLMITACAQKGQVERARNVLEEMQLLQLSPTEVTYNAQIDACAQRRDYYAEAFLNLERMKTAGFRPDEVTYSALLNASAKNGDVKMAEIVFKNMSDSGMIVAKPEATRFWNSLLSAYATAQPHADSLTRTTTITTASRILNTMKQIQQQPDRFTANTLLSLYTHAHRVRTAETLFDAAFLSPRPLAITVGLQTDAKHHETSQEAAALSGSYGDHVAHSSANRSKSTTGELWAFNERFPPDVVTFTCLVQLYADTRRPEKALHAWQLMKESASLARVTSTQQ